MLWACTSWGGSRRALAWGGACWPLIQTRWRRRRAEGQSRPPRSSPLRAPRPTPMSAARNRRECAGVNARREREANVGHVEPSAKRARAPKAAKPTLQVPCDPSVFQQRLTAAGLPACFTGPLQLIGLCSREAQVAASAATVGEATWLSTADVALVVAVALPQMQSPLVGGTWPTSRAVRGRLRLRPPPQVLP